MSKERFILRQCLGLTGFIFSGYTLCHRAMLCMTFCQ